MLVTADQQKKTGTYYKIIIMLIHLYLTNLLCKSNVADLSIRMKNPKTETYLSIFASVDLLLSESGQKSAVCVVVP